MAEYQQRKEASLCTRCGAPAAEDSSLCEEHRDDLRWRRKRWIKELRKARKKAGLCMYCPSSGPVAKVVAPEKCCEPCRIRRCRLSSSVGVDGAVDNRGAKIAAATRKGDDGRVRYHGQQKRGQQPKHQLNLQDLRHVEEDFDTFKQCIEKLAKPDMQAKHKSDREKAEKATADVGDRMCRRTDDILERLGHFKQRHGRRDGE